MNALAQRAAALLGSALRSATPCAGGDLSTVWRIELADGRCAVVKTGPSPEQEAGMLNALRAAGAPTPQVLAVDPETLVLSCVDGGTGAGNAWASLGCALRALHSHCGDRYGWPHDYAFGALRIDNTPCANWPLFWAQCRLLPFVSRLPVSLVRRVEQLAASLGERLPAQPPAALLHGDLWGGNVLVHDHEVAALIDPACYYGDAEVDLAMLQLFDRPDPTFFAHYGPLRAGHVERLPIYRLWPALVHLTLFGDTYLPLVEAQLHDAGV